jgi:alkylhydroperoxidase family enzyme
MKEMPRATPLNVDDMKPEWKEILKRIPGDGLKGKYAPVNVLGCLMFNPDTLGQFLDYWVTSKLKMGLTVREQELVILRMAFLYDCDYVWRHHVPVGTEFGINKDELKALKTKDVPAVFNERESALLTLTDEMMNQRDVSRASWDKYKPILSDMEMVDLISLVSQYVLYALTNNVMRTQIEDNLKDIDSLYD